MTGRTLKAPPLILRWVLYAAAAQLIVSVPLDLLRLGWPAWQDVPIIWQYPKVLFGASVALAALYICARLANRRLRFDFVATVLLLMVLLGTMNGLVKVAFEIHPWRFFIPHLASGVMMLFCYLAFANLDGAYDDWLRRFFSRVSTAVFWTMVIGFSLFVWRRYTADRVIYWGFNSQNLIVPFVWFAIAGSPFKAGAAALMVVLNGKRGVVLALAAVLGALVVRDLFRQGLNAKLRAVLATSVLMVMLGGAVAVVAFADPESLPAGLSDTVWKWNLLNPAQENFDPELASAGRFLEIQDSMRAWAALPEGYVAGSGYGFWFRSLGLLERDYSDIRLHYIHFSPLNFVYQTGPFLAFGLFAGITLLIGRTFVRALRTADGARNVRLVICLVVVADLAGGLTGYSYGTDTKIWALLGLLASMERTAPA
jgi:hypothetical protein